eukprot:1835017-Prymnesium_polylepis.3
MQAPAAARRYRSSCHAHVQSGPHGMVLSHSVLQTRTPSDAMSMSSEASRHTEEEPEWLDNAHHQLAELSAAEPNALTTHPNTSIEQTRSTHTLLVVGECGDGKSTLVNAFRDPELSVVAEAGKTARGVTKDIRTYVGKPINDHPIRIIDTPGIGDGDITVTKLLAMLEGALVTGDSPPIDAVLVTAPITDNRIKLGAQVVHFLVDKGFVGGQEKWQNVVLVGTKNDKAEHDDRVCFENEVVKKIFEDAKDSTGPYALTSKDDYSSLRDILLKLPNMIIEYKSPGAKEMSEGLAEKLGMDPGKFEKEMNEHRREIERLKSSRNVKIAGISALTITIVAACMTLHNWEIAKSAVEMAKSKAAEALANSNAAQAAKDVAEFTLKKAGIDFEIAAQAAKRAASEAEAAMYHAEAAKSPKSCSIL